MEGPGSGITTAGVVVVALLLGGFAWLPALPEGGPGGGDCTGRGGRAGVRTGTVVLLGRPLAGAPVPAFAGRVLHILAGLPDGPRSCSPHGPGSRWEWIQTSVPSTSSQCPPTDWHRLRLIPRPLLAARKGGVFFLHGEDEFRKQASARFLVERYADPATRDFNLDRLQGSEVSVERLASVFATPPMMAEWRVVHLKETEALAASPRARQVILGVAKDPPPGLALILQATIPRKSKARFYKDLARVATSVEFKPVSVDAVPSWLVTWADEELGAKLELDAARALAQSAGIDLGVLTQEVRKLAEMVESGDPIGLEVVRRGGVKLPQQDRWAWFDLVGNRRIEEAMRGLPVLLGQGETAIGTGDRSLDPSVAGGDRGRRRGSGSAGCAPAVPAPSWLAAS